jgi:hypothetical protein
MQPRSLPRKVDEAVFDGRGLSVEAHLLVVLGLDRLDLS